MEKHVNIELNISKTTIVKKKFPLYIQLDKMDCGPTCLRMISKYYGRSYSIEYLRDQSFISRLGVSMLGISDAAEQIGFRTISVRSSLKQLAEEAIFPCILHWNQSHFVVCYEIKHNKSFFTNKKSYTIKIADPAGSIYEMTEIEFSKSWVSSVHEGIPVGTALIITPTPEFYKLELDSEVTKNKKELSYFLRYFYPYKSQYLQLIIGMLIGNVLAFISPFLMQSIVDQGIGNENIELITLILIAQVVIVLTMTLMGFIQSWISLYINTIVNIALVSDFLNKLMALPLRFFDKKNTGDIMQRIVDHDRIKSFLTDLSISSIFSVVNFIIFSFILAYYNVNIFMIFIIGSILYILWILLFMKYRKKIDYSLFSQNSAERNNMFGMITGMQDIKLNNCERQERWKWERIRIRLFKINIKGITIGQIQQLGTLFILQLTTVIITYLSAKSVVLGDITLGMMMSISYILGQLTGPIGQFISILHSFQDAKISLERINEVNNELDERHVTKSSITELNDVKDIVFSNVFFSYSGSKRDYILKDISFTIPQNKITAIVGSSGCGKTTLLKLLLGFYKPQEGTITVSGTNLYSILPQFWRYNIGAVLQDGFIFSDTIAYNIAPGELNIDTEKLRFAAHMANIEDFIESLPLKYNTKIGTEGNGMSQGQKQRLLIARAIYKNPDFILFDEATNALDSINEKTIMNNLNTFFKNKTVVIVAHRLSTVKEADNIIVLDKGKIVEQGTHEDLSNSAGTYYELVKNQLDLGT